MSEKEAVAPVIQIPPVGRRLFERKDAPARPVPLFREPLPMFSEGNGERFQERRRSGVEPVSESKPHRELPSVAQVQFAGEGEVSVQGPVEFPVHPVVVGEVRPAVASAHVAAGQAREGDGCGQREPDPVFLGGQDLPARDFPHVGVVPPPPHAKVGGAQGVESESFQK